MNIATFSLSLLALSTLSSVAHAVDGEILITHEKALAGNITPGDTPGYPITLSKSGKYKLAGNLVLPDGNTNGINITASHLEIDLNGFGIHGPNSCNTSGGSACTHWGMQVGILSSQSDITVKNGTIRGMAYVGLTLGAGSLVSDLDVSHNTASGISMDTGIIRGVRVHHNGGIGIGITSGLVSGSFLEDNGDSGVVVVGKGTLLNGNSIHSNGGWGIEADASTLGKSGYCNNVLINNTNGKALNLTDMGGNL